MFLVTGASGNVGAELVDALANAGEKVRALTRGTRPLALPSGVEAVAVGDPDRGATWSAALTDVCGVFLLSEYTTMPGLLSAIRDADVKRVVLLTSGAVVGGDVGNAVVRDYLLAEAAVRESGLAWTILRPSGFQSNALRWIPQLRAGNVVRAPFADVPIAAIDPLDIAAVAALALTAPGHDGSHHRLTGPDSLLPADQVRILADVLGRELRLEALNDVDAREQMSSSNMPTGYVDAMFSFVADGTYDDSQVHPTVAQLTGRPPRSFQQWATAHVKDFR